MKCIAAHNNSINNKVIFFIATVNKFLVLNRYVVKDLLAFFFLISNVAIH